MKFFWTEERLLVLARSHRPSAPPGVYVFDRRTGRFLARLGVIRQEGARTAFVQTAGGVLQIVGPHHLCGVLTTDRSFDRCVEARLPKRAKYRVALPGLVEAVPHVLSRAAAAIAEVFDLTLEGLPAEEGAGLWPQPVHERIGAR